MGSLTDRVHRLPLADPSIQDAVWIPGGVREMLAGEQCAAESPLSADECTTRIRALLEPPPGRRLPPMVGSVQGRTFIVQMRRVAEGSLGPARWTHGSLIPTPSGTTIRMRTAAPPRYFVHVPWMTAAGVLMVILSIVAIASGARDRHVLGLLGAGLLLVGFMATQVSMMVWLDRQSDWNQAANAIRDAVSKP